jgi:hypothetical protein
MNTLTGKLRLATKVANRDMTETTSTPSRFDRPGFNLPLNYSPHAAYTTTEPTWGVGLGGGRGSLNVHHPAVGKAPLFPNILDGSSR